jgi:hypothetical protein
MSVRHKNISGMLSRSLKLCITIFCIWVNVHLRYLGPRTQAASSQVKDVTNSD